MSAFYDRMRATATRLVNRFDQGGTSILLEVVTRNPDPRLPPTVVATTRQIPAVAFGVKENMVTADANIVATDMYVIVGAEEGYVPVAGDKVRINSSDRLITVVRPIPAAGMPCAYKFFVR